MRRFTALVIASTLAAVAPAQAADRTFESGSLIIPMDLTYQSTGMLQAYGLLYQLLRGNVHVYWVILPAPNKQWQPPPSPWDCGVDGSGVKCNFPTATPDFTATTKVVWSDVGTAPDTVIGAHPYRGGPFVIDVADKAAALSIINAWNTNVPARAVFKKVTVHEATAAFTGNVAKEMIAAPTIAVFADKNEDIATGYLRAAGIPQSNGSQFPSATCNGNCGPGTANPDLLTEEAIMGPLGTCSAPDYNHKNGALWRSDGLPAYCQIMSMHWNVSERDTVTCEGGCGTDITDCNGQAYTFNGHEVVAEVRAFLAYPVHFFAECQAVNAYENTSPNPDYPFLDDDGRDGHFLTTTGTPPPCPCLTGFSCDTATNTCVPTDDREKNAGFLIGTQPNSQDVQILRPDVPYAQMDGAFGTTNGSEPAYNLSDYLMTTYKNDRQVTFITDSDGPGHNDIWMSGYLDGACDIILGPSPGGTLRAGNCHSGKVSYLGGHQYSTTVPISTTASATEGTRMFLNALFEADCVTADGQPSFQLTLTPSMATGPSLPVTTTFTVGFANGSAGFAYDGALHVTLPTGVTASQTTGAIEGPDVSWLYASIGGAPGQPGDPASSASENLDLSFPAGGDYPIDVTLTYKVGTTTLTASQTFVVHAGVDSDGDGVSDDVDEDPNDPNVCGDFDNDGCDDCAPSCDGGGGAGKSGGCCDTGATPSGPAALAFVVLVLLARRRRVR